MANSSILGGTPAAPRPPGRDVDTLGPSDTSDSGSDVRVDAHTTNPDGLEGPGPLPVEHRSDTDSAGTGERGSATGDDPREAGDIQPDHLEGDPSVGSDEDLDAEPVSGDTLDDVAADEDYEAEGLDVSLTDLPEDAADDR